MAFSTRSACAIVLAVAGIASCYRAGDQALDQDAGSDGGDELAIDCLTERVETFWGDAPDAATRHDVFDAFWTALAHYYAAFETTSVDWDALRDSYLSRLAEADGQGRFYALLSEAAIALRDGHTVLVSEQIYGFDGPPHDPFWPAALDLAARPPAFWLEDRLSAIGACVTPLDDGTLLVYRVEAGNPADLELGDVVLGYDGRAWADLLPAIDACSFPVVGRAGSSPASHQHKRLAAVVNNPHLFDELDVWRRGSGAADSVPTDGLVGFGSDLICDSHVDVAGVAPPCTHWNACYQDPSAVPQVTWGVLSETDVGYIYVYSWQGNAGMLFAEAVANLIDTSGLIVDQRSGPGGDMLWGQGLALLFEESVEEAIVFLERDDQVDDYEALVPDPEIEPIGVTADPLTVYDRPIAVLTGPHAGSAGDIFPFLLGLHPRARRFGRPTDGRFGLTTHTIANSGSWFPETDPFSGDLHASYTVAIMADADGVHLQGAPPAPEVEVWLEPDDVAAGVDTVVDAALVWIALENGD